MAKPTIVELERSIFALNQANKKGIPITKAQIAANVVLGKTLGPHYNIYKNLAAALKTFGQIVKNIGNPLKAIALVFGGMRDNLFFLIGILALVGTAVTMLTSNLTGTGESVSIFDASLGDLGLTTENLQMLFDAFVGALTIGFDVLVASWSAVITNMQQTGFIDALLGMFEGFYLGVQAAFSGISEAFAILGVDGNNLAETFTGLIDGLFAVLVSAGFMEYINEFAATIGLMGQALGTVLGAVAVLIANVIKEATTGGTLLNTIVTTVGGVIVKIFQGIFAIASFVLSGILLYFKGVIWLAENGFSGLRDVIVGKFNDILGKAGEWKDKIANKLGGMWDFLMSPIQWILDKIDELKNIDLDSLVPDVSDIGGSVLDALTPWATGGIASGPQSGYAVALHGTEAVVPLPDGRSIPVTLQGGGGGGGGFTANITVNSTGGDARAIAKAVSDEVQKAFRSRSRSGGFGRGI